MDIRSITLGLSLGCLEIGLIFLVGYLIGLEINKEAAAIVVILAFVINLIIFLAS
jgi:hypothetical protein